MRVLATGGQRLDPLASRCEVSIGPVPRGVGYNLGMAKTPAMQQFDRFKAQHPDCILLFRMGDFYELFYEDAVIASKAVGLTLTKRTEGVPMAGVPYHQLENYLRRLIAQGYRVAVCDQVQDPKEAKGVVERAVTRVVTPGTLVDDGLLDDDTSNRIAALTFVGPGETSDASIAYAELSTGVFRLVDATHDEVVDVLARAGVREVLYPECADGEMPPRVKRVVEALGLSTSARPSWQFRPDEAREALLRQFGVRTLDGFGLASDDPAIPAAGALVRALCETQVGATTDASMYGKSHRPRSPLAHLEPPKREGLEAVCVLDATTLRSLEIDRTMRGGTIEGSLLSVFQERAIQCRTPMGRRQVREWLCAPLGSKATIETRQRAVASLVEDVRASDDLRGALDGVQDVARIAGRLALGRLTPRDLVGLGTSLERLETIEEAIADAPAFVPSREALSSIREALTPLASSIMASCIEEAPAHLREGGLIRDGVDAELDEARSLQHDAGAWLATYQQDLIETHDLPSIKVKYNRVFGYFIELPAGQAARAPDIFTRRQTLKNAERYITPELKTFEDKVTTAQARAVEREQALFRDLCHDAEACLGAIVAFASTVADLDVLLCFADKARRRGWSRPTIVD
ncbi:MAG: DNA mismatch repair protein MutS, partial [Phycisphaerales bacterium]|nr:DNA mismatch repair protein MutS [Phycisphaerales bacterium]